MGHPVPLACFFLKRFVFFPTLAREERHTLLQFFPPIRKEKEMEFHGEGRMEESFV